MKLSLTSSLSIAAFCLMMAKAPVVQAQPPAKRSPREMWQQLKDEGKLPPVIVDVASLMVKGIGPVTVSGLTGGVLPIKVKLPVMKDLSVQTKVAAGATGGVQTKLSATVKLPMISGIEVGKLSIGTVGPVQVTIPATAKLPGLVSGVKIGKLSMGAVGPVQTTLPTTVKLPELVTGSGPEAKLLLADAYAEARDERAVAIYEEVLAMFKPVAKVSATREQKPDKGLGRVPVESVLERLAAYYKQTGNNAKAAETLLRADEFETPAWFKANVVVEASRLYREAGDEKKAQELYGKVAKRGYGWATGVALYDQGLYLVEKGRHEEARKLLNTPVTGQYADQVKIGLLSLLGRSYYSTGEWKEAQKYSAQAIAQYKALKTPLSGEGLEWQVEVAQGNEKWSRQWQQGPLVCEPKELRVAINQTKQRTPLSGAEKKVEDAAEEEPVAEGQALIRHLQVRSARSMEITATSDNADVQVTIAPTESDRGLFREREITVTIAPAILKALKASHKSLKATLRLRSVQDKKFELTVPVQIEWPVAAG